MRASWAARPPQRPAIISGALAVLLAVIVATPVWLAQDDRGAGGVTEVVGGGGGIQLTPSLDELIASADVIVVGTVTSIRGPEVVLPADPPERPGPVRVHRVTYRIEEVLRGSAMDELVLMNGERRGMALFSAEVGEGQIVFAAQGPLGSPRVTAWTPVWEEQGVFSLTAGGVAKNGRGMSFELVELERRFDAVVG